MKKRDTSLSVSYTHLDVYKRQVQNITDFFLKGEIPNEICYQCEQKEPVSYTHLDVYKRQG